MYLLKGKRIVIYDGKEFKVVHEYNSSYCEITENNESNISNIILVKSSELKEVIDN
jgi:hypothetical protein